MLIFRYLYRLSSVLIKWRDTKLLSWRFIHNPVQRSGTLNSRHNGTDHTMRNVHCIPHSMKLFKNAQTNSVFSVRTLNT